jgi:hypothetical protein
MACAFETTGAICKEVTPLIDRIARSTALGTLGYHVQGSKGKNLPTPLVCLTKMERSLNRNECRLNDRPKEKYPRKQLSEK